MNLKKKKKKVQRITNMKAGRTEKKSTGKKRKKGASSRGGGRSKVSERRCLILDHALDCPRGKSGEKGDTAKGEQRLVRSHDSSEFCLKKDEKK